MNRNLLTAATKYKFLVKVFFVLLFFFPDRYTFSQTKDDITYIVFDLQHTFRISDHHVMINITKLDKNILLHLSSFPMKHFEKKYPKTDTTFTIENSEFAKLTQAVSLLNDLDTAKANVHGYDGIYCKIHYGSKEKSKAYDIWSPDFDTNQRGLNDYFNACYAIIRAAHLSFKIFE